MDTLTVREVNSTTDLGAIDGLRAPYYERYGRQIDPEPAGTSWLVAEVDGRICACVGLLEDPVKGIWWAIDLLGDAKGVNRLREYIQTMAQLYTTTIRGWMAVDNKHIFHAVGHGWKPIAVLVEYGGNVSSDQQHSQ